MSSKSCKDCAAWQHNTYREWHYCAQGQADICSGNTKACKYFKSATVFQKITESPEVLAPCFVEKQPDKWDDDDYPYYSYLTREWYATEDKAIAATVERLKEVAE